MKRLLTALYLGGNRFIGWLLESVLAAVVPMPEHRVVPVFIVGAPRSGTTLVFQLLVTTFDFGYLTNLHCRAFGCPALVSYIRNQRQRESDFTSRYGRTLGWHGPSECGEWWYRFFSRDPVYATNKDVSARSGAAFQRSLTLLAAAEGRPLIFKNLFASLRLEPIVREFPEAVFIHVRRGIRQNAQSILEGRKSSLGTYGAWWSVPPPGFEDLLQLSPVRQVIAQIEMIDRQIVEDAERLGISSRLISVKYEDVCAAPRDIVSKLEARFAALGVDPARIGNPPSRFEISDEIRIPQPLYSELVTLTEKD
ncbi:sulfotransferase [Parvibaculum sp.]|uniref:sulfotransferase n=1 Tax=Parvibaculum sp. TaxID=2024848 RepID=UPI001B170187|nr:sulfotransferase [Parvibaculum sp.]MBO6668053.1 sulfotransferase [Parvibaculum sp.]MBO6692049.1 sulfotransferase [Parvibaculum sp.]MBO6715631.1 sulfotransferase [Parvibaculum sp.]